MKNEIHKDCKNTKKEWIKPSIHVLGDAKHIIKEAKFSGFTDGVTFNGSPIGESG